MEEAEAIRHGRLKEESKGMGSDTTWKEEAKAGAKKALVRLKVGRDGSVKRRVTPLLKGKSLNERAKILDVNVLKEDAMNRAHRRRMISEAVRERSRGLR